MNAENAEEAQKLDRAETTASKLAWPSLLFAVLQSVCTALIAASGIRFAIGISSFISAIVTSTTAQDFHRDAIRLPMLAFALLGAGVNLVVLWQVWRLRRRPASQWRIGTISPQKKRMEQLQLALSLITILFVAAELLAHKHLHGVYL